MSAAFMAVRARPTQRGAGEQLVVAKSLILRDFARRLQTSTMARGRLSKGTAGSATGRSRPRRTLAPHWDGYGPRAVNIKTADGKFVALEVPASAKRFGELKVGDRWGHV
jgi:hypothetical protein